MMAVVAHALEYPFESPHLENRFLFLSAQRSLPLWSIQRYPLPLFFSPTVYPIHPSFPLYDPLVLYIRHELNILTCLLISLIYHPRLGSSKT